MNRAFQFLLIAFQVLILKETFSQNIVQNPSFELYTACPTTQAQINYAQYWEGHNNNVATTPSDYYNSCGTFSTPTNWAGFQIPVTGNAYVSIFTYYSTVREIIGSQLATPMIVGNTYYVSFYASPILKSSLCATMATDKLGIKFSTINYTPTTNALLVNNFAHVYSADVITDTANWTIVSGTIIADSAYTYIYAGLFFDGANVDTLHYPHVGCTGAYYYVDDICVSENPSECPMAIATSIEKKHKKNVNIFPNPTSSQITISFSDPTLNSNIKIVDLLGKEVKSVLFSGSELILDLEQDLKPGIYIIQISSSDSVLAHEKVVVQ